MKNLKLDESCISNPKSEIFNSTANRLSVAAGQASNVIFRISDLRLHTTGEGPVARAFLLIDREAVEVACPAGHDQTLFGAICAEMRRIPGRVAATAAVRMAEHGSAIHAVGGPVVAGRLKTRRKRPAGGIRAGQHVMFIGLVTDTLDDFAFLGQCIRFLDVVTVAQGVTVQIGNVACDQDTLGIVPGSGSNASTRIDEVLYDRGDE